MVEVHRRAVQPVDESDRGPVRQDFDAQRLPESPDALQRHQLNEVSGSGVGNGFDEGHRDAYRGRRGTGGFDEGHGRAVRRAENRVRTERLGVGDAAQEGDPGEESGRHLPWAGSGNDFDYEPVRIDRPSVLAHLVMDVRTGRDPRPPHQRDDLAALPS